MTLIDSEQDFSQWLAHMQPVLAGFEDFAMPAGWSRGFTRESLAELEAYLLDRWANEDEYLARADPAFIDGAGRYLGEAYLRVAGGGWDIQTEPGGLYARRPFIVTEVSDGVPLAPFLLVTAAIYRRTGTEFSRVYDNLLGRVEARRADLGSTWQPERLPVPGVTEGTAEEREGSAEAREWAGSVDSRIEALRSRLGAARAGQLDLTPASLPAAEEAALSELAPGDVDEHAPTEVHQQYVAYLGATLLATAGGRWVFRPGNPDENLYLGNPYVLRTDKAGDPRATVPLFRLRRLVESREPGVFARALSNYAGS